MSSQLEETDDTSCSLAEILRSKPKQRYHLAVDEDQDRMSAAEIKQVS
jgi:hypothetical protein